MEEKRSDKKEITGWKKYILNEYVLSTIIVGSLFIFVKAFHFVKVDGSSMMPTYQTEELLTTTTNVKDIKLNDVVVFIIDSKEVQKDQDPAKNHKENLVKRVVGVEGDIIEIKDKKLYRNKELVDDGFGEIENAGIATEPVEIPKGEIFVLGDNHNHSTDSRTFGTIKKETVTNIVRGSVFKFFKNLLNMK